jgi:hypothetical protein
MAVYDDIFAIVTAGRSAVFRIAITGLLDDLGIEYSCCDDVYAATAELAGRRNGKILVVGTLCELSREQMRFFHICRRRPLARCFCLADSEASGKIVQAVREGAAVAGDIKELKQMIAASLAVGSDKEVVSTEIPDKSASRKQIDHDVHLTKDELDVVLGV